MVAQHPPELLDAIEKRICALVDSDPDLYRLVRSAAGDAEDLSVEGTRVLAEACEQLSERLHANPEVYPGPKPEREQRDSPARPGMYL